MTNPAVAACLLAIVLGCATAPRWESSRSPDALDAAAILAEDGLGLTRDERADEVPVVPVRKRLRPCCAFGSDLRVRVGVVNIPGVAIGKILSPDELGRHTYDAGQRGTDQVMGTERNGLVYTCQGGFIDTAHVRDYADWTFYLATEFGRRLETGGVIELEDLEGGRRRFVLQPVDPELVATVGRRKMMASLAVWAGFQMSTWHEIATWYGWASFELFSERASAFSPEDQYSNLLGAKIAGAIVSGGGGLSETTFNRAVDAWFSQFLAFLGAVSAEDGERAMSSVEGVWWDSSARLPDANLVMRRSIQHGIAIEPWLVPASAWEGTRADEGRGCSVSASAHVLRNPSRMPLLDFSDILELQIDLGVERNVHPELAGYGGRVTQADFGTILERIRILAKAEFGDDADRPGGASSSTPARCLAPNSAVCQYSPDSFEEAPLADRHK